MAADDQSRFSNSQNSPPGRRGLLPPQSGGPLGGFMKEIVALYSIIGVILLSAFSFGAVVAHAL